MFSCCVRLGFFGRQLVYPLPDRSHHGEGKHDERDMTMPAMPRPGLVMVETEFVLGGLEAVFDRPAMSLDTDRSVDRSMFLRDTMW